MTIPEQAQISAMDAAIRVLIAILSNEQKETFTKMMRVLATAADAAAPDEESALTVVTAMLEYTDATIPD